MKITVKKGSLADVKTEAFILVFCEGEKTLSGPAADIDQKSGGLLSDVIKSGDFEAKPSQVLVIYAGGFKPAKRIALAGLGKNAGVWVFFLFLFGFFALFMLLLLASAPARAYREARMFLLQWNNIGVSQVARFRCTLSVRGFVWLRVRNLLLTLLTLGFYRPFARVSEYAMKLESVTLHVKGGVDQLAGQMLRHQEGGLGDALADAAGLDLIG